MIHEAPASRADKGLTAAVEGAARASEALFWSFWREEGEGGDELEEGEPPTTTTQTTRLHVSRARASGAGHDALALSEARDRDRDRAGLPWAMLFVRDVGGVSHSSAGEGEGRGRGCCRRGAARGRGGALGAVTKKKNRACIEGV